MYTLRTQMVAPVAVREAFDIFEDPRNLARITPPSLQFRLITPEPVEMRKEAVFDYTIRWAGLPLRWRTLITEYEPPFLFIDEQVKGPYLLWRHKHTFHPTEEGTLVTDEVDYILPLGWMGRATHNAMIARQLKAIFQYRQMTLNEILCGGKARWTDPAITEKRPGNPPAETASRETRKRAVSSSPEP